MQRVLTADLDFGLEGRVDLVFQLSAAHPAPLQSESLTFHLGGRDVAATEIVDRCGSRLHRVSGESGLLRVRYRAVVEGRAEAAPASMIETLSYLRPSRYCPADEVYGHTYRFRGLRGAELVRAVDAFVAENTVYAPGEIEITSATGTPEDPYVPPTDPYVPEPPAPPSPPMIQTSTVETTALGDADGNVEWVVVATTEADGTGKIEAEALPRRMISDYLPAPKIFRPIQQKSLKRSMTVEDKTSIEALGEQEKRVRFAGVDSWGALQQYAEAALKDAARCVRGKATIPCNPLLRSGDTVNYSGHEWYVERANHNFSDWTTSITMRRVPSGAEIAGVFFSSPGNAESAIVRVVKDATGRVNNAVEATVLQKLDARTYTVKVQNSDEIVTVKSDHVIFGDLIAGRTILIGRGTK